MKFSIITPTTGNKHLVKLLESINSQITMGLFEIEHHIIIDGLKFETNTLNMLDKVKPKYNRYITKLGFNSGSNGYLGHKIYAGFIQFITSDYIIFLDDDNWIDESHILNYYNLISKYNIDWCFCLRNIITQTDNFECEDNCESLGNLSNCYNNTNEYLIDSSCYCIKYDIIKLHSHIWNAIGTNNYTNPDRKLGIFLLNNYTKYLCTFKYTLNYRISTRETSVGSNFFTDGNEIYTNYYNQIPWKKFILTEPIYLIHFDSTNTDNIIRRIYLRDKKSIAYNQWQLNIMDCFENMIVLNGYNKYIPSGSKILIHMCNPNLLPIELMERTDVYKILYTIESPNVRHQNQWDLNFLKKYFNLIITYWKPLINLYKTQYESVNNFNIIYHPFIHRYNFRDIYDNKWIYTNDNYTKSVCIILENRNYFQKYKINNIELMALDYLRAQYALPFNKQIDCWGNSWENYANIINCCKTSSRFEDKEYVVDIMKNYTFCLIIENCDALGYISEKIYDAFSAGCIPLYYGNNDDNLIPYDSYIDIKKFTPSSLVKYINRLTQVEIENYKKNINSNRLNIFEKVSITKYNDLIKSKLENYY
jgi:hypothetical protein